MQEATHPTVKRRGEIALIFRFAAVGAAGFSVDAAVLMSCVHALGMDPAAARFISFAVAVVCTFQLNRSWAFRRRADPGFIRGIALYLGVQGLGFGTNLAVYSVLVAGASKPWNAPLLCLTVASGVAMIMNYLGSRSIVFRGTGD